MYHRELLPSARSEADAAAIAEARKKADERSKGMREDFTRTFQTESGKRVLAWLKNRCGFRKIILSADRQSGQIDPLLTTFAAMEYNLYIEITNNLPINLIQEIEDERRINPSGSLSGDSTDKPNGRITSRRSRKPS